LLLTVSVGEKERINQQQSDGFARKGTTHHGGYYYKNGPQMTRISEEMSKSVDQRLIKTYSQQP
jgi:hypothetical protein